MAELDGPFLDRLAAAAALGRASLEPEVVLVASNRLGRDLGRRLGERAGGWANVRFLTLLDLARSLARSELSGDGRPHLRHTGKLALAREVLRRAKERDPAHAFAPIAERRGFPPALAALFDDLIDSLVDELPAAGLSRVESRRYGALADLYRDWRRLLAERALHPAEVIARGASRAGEFRERFGTSRLWLSGFYELTPNQGLLISGLVAAGVKITADLPFPGGPFGRFAGRLRDELSVLGAEVLGPPAGSSGGTDLGRLKDSLFLDPGPVGPSREPDGTLEVVSAPDEEREVREAARGALRLFEKSGIGFDRMAVAFPGSQRGTYAPLIGEIFAAAGIPHESRLLKDLSGEPEGRHLRALLAVLGDAAPRRARLLDLLNFEGVPFPVSPGRLERLSRRGGISAWAGDWEVRLLEAARRRSLEDEDGAPRGAADPQVEAAVPLIREILDLAVSFPSRGTWGDLLDRLDRVAAKAFPAYRTHPEIARIATELRRLGDLEGEIGLAEFNAAWEEELRSAQGSAPRGPGGVAVGDLMELRGVPFDAVFLLGVVERSFPALPRTDPLLPDSDRAALDQLAAVAGRLSLKGERLAEEDLIFAWTAASVRRKLQMSYPRRDSSTGRPRLPSIFLLRAAEVLAGGRLGAEDLDSQGAVRRVGLTHGKHPYAESLTVEELDLAVAVSAGAGELPRTEVRRWFEALSPPVERIAALEEMKWDHRLGAADGIVPAGLLARLPGGRITGAGGSISATRIQSYVECPYRYLQRHILGLEEAEDPGTVFEISSLDRGTLVHRILERVYRALKEERLLPLDRGRTARAEAILERVLEEEFARAEREFPLGPAPLREIARREIASSLAEFLRAEAESEEGWVPVMFEAVFGSGGGAPAVRIEIPAGPDGGGQVSVPLGGKIDRIDIARGGKAFRVIDYKTGARLPEAPFDGGKSLQLPIYLLAAPEILAALGEEAEVSGSQAAYLSLEGKSRVFPGGGQAEWVEKLRLALRTVSRGIEAGIFYPTPGAERRTCRGCDFKDHCDPRVESIAGRKEDERAGPLEEMKRALENPRKGKG